MGKNLIISDYCYTFAATNTHATMKSPRLFFIFCHLLLGISIVSAKESDAIRRNQVGYYPQQEKVVVVEGVNPKDIAVLGRTNDEKASLNIISLNQKGGMRLLDTVTRGMETEMGRDSIMYKRVLSRHPSCDSGSCLH